jgi:hypothetical protein
MNSPTTNFTVDGDVLINQIRPGEPVLFGLVFPNLQKYVGPFLSYAHIYSLGALDSLLFDVVYVNIARELIMYLSERTRTKGRWKYLCQLKSIPNPMTPSNTAMRSWGHKCTSAIVAHFGHLYRRHHVIAGLLSFICDPTCQVTGDFCRLNLKTIRSSSLNFASLRTTRQLASDITIHQHQGDETCPGAHLRESGYPRSSAVSLLTGVSAIIALLYF